MFDEFESKYSTKEQELLVLTKICKGASCYQKQICIVSMEYIALLDPFTNEIISEHKSLAWPTFEQNLYTKQGIDKLKNEHIYRIKARKLLEDNRSDKDTESWYLTEIISDNESNDILDDKLTKYKKDITYEDEIIGTFILNKILNCYDKDIKWLNMRHAELSVYVQDLNNLKTYKKSFKVAQELYKNQVHWDTVFKEAAADALLDLANTWLQNTNILSNTFYQEQSIDDRVDNTSLDKHNKIVLNNIASKTITKENFISRIYLNSIIVQDDGSLTIYYNDDNLFNGHVIEMYGTILGGIDEAHIAG